MPAPRAVARQIRPGERPPAPARRPMSDLTTTMPILAAPIEDLDVRNAPPGEYGHFHDHDDNGRHRAGARSPRTLKVAAVLLGVAAAGAAVAGAFAGGSDKSGTGTPQAAGVPTSGAAPAQVAAVPDVSSSAAGTTAGSSSSSAPTPTPTPTRSTKSPTPTKASTSPSTEKTTPEMAPRPSSSAPTSSAPSTPPSTPPTTAPPTTPASFVALKYRDSGPAVSKLQVDLLAAGYGWDMYGYQDGQFDRPTKRAVQDFQMNHPGTADADGYGVYGAATAQALQNAIKGATNG
ncbi:hypothetical protein GCM10009839_83660 [Catenulispora yoronensis]|uniref:Peptidoglycan binding-like domain-containing protein n=2 Tax=Catenulispora yoronensis TaxID=450799 RepID=A0ABP5GXX2_9ACTN